MKCNICIAGQNTFLKFLQNFPKSVQPVFGTTYKQKLYVFFSVICVFFFSLCEKDWAVRVAFGGEEVYSSSAKDIPDFLNQERLERPFL